MPYIAHHLSSVAMKFDKLYVLILASSSILLVVKLVNSFGVVTISKCWLMELIDTISSDLVGQ